MKKNLLCLGFSVFLMMCLPLFSILWAGMNAMAIIFILFFAVNPIYSVCVGVFAGRDIKKRWWQPILSAFLFFAGAWIFFDAGESDFLYCTVIYLIIGLISMGITKLIKTKKQVN